MTDERSLLNELQTILTWEALFGGNDADGDCARQIRVEQIIRELKRPKDSDGD
jgi:hypothetical protein